MLLFQAPVNLVPKLFVGLVVNDYVSIVGAL